MSYVPIDPSEIMPGKPAKNELFTKISNSLGDHEERIEQLESTGSNAYAPIIFTIKGPYRNHATAVGLAKTTFNFSIEITGVRILIDRAGSSGSTSIDLKYKRGSGAWTSIFATPPTIAFGAGDDAVSAPGVLDPTHTTLQAGDLLRLDMLSAQARASGLMVRIDFAKV